MQQQKVVIKVSMNDNKSRSKALKIAVGCLGVVKAGLTGDDKDKIEVVGDGVDPVELVCLLRKRFGFAELESVGPAEEKKKDPELKTIWDYGRNVPHYQIYQVPSYEYQYPYCNDQNSCIIM